MASELGLDVRLARRGALLHDIGKAVSHEEEGPHAMLGAEIAKKYGESEKIVNAIAAHHEQVPPICPESVLVAAAEDVIAGVVAGDVVLAVQGVGDGADGGVAAAEQLDTPAVTDEDVLAGGPRAAEAHRRVVVAEQRVGARPAPAAEHDVLAVAATDVVGTVGGQRLRDDEVHTHRVVVVHRAVRQSRPGLQSPAPDGSDRSRLRRPLDHVPRQAAHPRHDRAAPQTRLRALPACAWWSRHR